MLRARLSRPTATAVLALASLPAMACGGSHVVLVVPFAPGGSTDAVARVVADRASQLGGKPFVIRHVSGASGLLGSHAVAHAAPDGCTVLFGTRNSVLLAPAQQRPRDPRLASLAPVIGLGSTPELIVALPTLDARKAEELRAAAGRLGRPLRSGHPGNDTTQAMNLQSFEDALGLTTTRVPYRGSGPLLNDLLAGHVDVAAVASPVAQPLLEQGRIVQVASVQDWLSRNGVQPARSWAGIFAPGGTPEAARRWLNDTVAKTLRQRDVREKLAGLGIVLPDDLSREWFERLVADEGRAAPPTGSK